MSELVRLSLANGYRRNRFPGKTRSGVRLRTGDGFEFANVYGDVEFVTAGEVAIRLSQHKYSSTQFDLDNAGYSRSQGSPLAKLRHMANAISDSDLAADGRENRLHITVKYGIQVADATAIRHVVSGFGPVVVQLGATSIFPAKQPSLDECDPLLASPRYVATSQASFQQLHFLTIALCSR